MLKSRAAAAPLLPVLTAMTIASCGDSVPLAPTSSGGPASIATSAMPAAPGPLFGGGEVQWGKFVLTKAAAGNATIVQGCNLDAIYNAPPGDAALHRDVKVLFAGWLADPSAGRVPARFQLLLRGTRAYELAVRGGAQTRWDVAAFFRNPALSRAGFRVMADLSAVTPGEYGVSFAYNDGDHAAICDSGRRVAVR